MPDPSFRQRALRRETLFGTFINTGSAVAAELCARAGFDWVLIDLEHGAGTEADLLAQLHAVASTPAVPVVRIERSERLRIARALDLGAAGIMVPRVETPEEAANALRFLRYPPSGVRGVALMTRGGDYGGIGHGAIAAVNKSVVGVVQIESPTAVENAEAIAAVDGVDVLFVGPSDLSHAMGIPGAVSDPAFDGAIRRVGEAASANGKAAGVLLWRAADLDRYADAGFTFLAISSDGSILADGAQLLLRDVRDRAARRRR